MCSYSERKADIHAGAVPFDGGIEEPFYLGERDDLVELRFHLGPCHAEDGPVEINILTPGKFGMKSGPDLKQRSDAAANARLPCGGVGDPAQNFQQRTFARP